MNTWTYDLAIPDDATEVEVDGYREIAISTWRTATEARGAVPGAVTVVLIENDPATQGARGTRRTWHVSGEIR